MDQIAFSPRSTDLQQFHIAKQTVKQIAQITKFMSWNGFNKNIRFSIIRKLKERQNLSKNQLTEQTGTDTS